MGGSSSKARIDKALGGSTIPETERIYGLENFGNTCYANSVLQALYFCKPLRDRCIEEALANQEAGVVDDDLLGALSDLFLSISTQRKRSGVHAPKRFVAKLRAENEIFNNNMHQDAHEFLNYLLNEMAEILEKRNKKPEDEAKRGPSGSGAAAAADASASGSASGGEGDSGKYCIRYGFGKPFPVIDPTTGKIARAPAAGAVGAGSSAGGASSSRSGGGSSSSGGGGSGGGGSSGGGDGASSKPSAPKTWVHNIFEGQLTNETRCLMCDTITSRDESFFDLSLEIEQNSSVSACMRNFSANESLRGENKFFCDTCCSLQEAHKRMRIKRLPNVLALHLKRFKYIEQLQRFKKLSYRIAFPIDLKLTNVCDEAVDPDRKYKLFAVIVHAGSGPNHGHYIALIRVHQQWLCFDDDLMEPIDEAQVQVQDSANGTRVARSSQQSRAHAQSLSSRRAHLRSPSSACACVRVGVFWLLTGDRRQHRDGLLALLPG